MVKKQKTIPQLEAEKAENERKISQLQHKKQQLENRITYYEKGDRRKRAHHLMQNKLTTPEELQERVSMLSDRIDTLKNSMRGKSNRMKELDELLRMVQFYTEGKPIADKLATIKWKGKREQFMSENENALRLYHMAERKLKPHFKDGKLPITAWRKERDRLEQEYKTGQAELSPIYAEVKKLWQIKYKVEQVIHEQERQNAVTRQKKQEIEH